MSSTTSCQPLLSGKLFFYVTLKANEYSVVLFVNRVIQFSVKSFTSVLSTTSAWHYEKYNFE
jgi:hypothetical protein